MIRWFYDMPYVRFQPYLIGIFFGYLFYKTKRTEFKIPHVSTFLNQFQKIYNLLAMLHLGLKFDAVAIESPYNGRCNFWSWCPPSQ